MRTRREKNPEQLEVRFGEIDFLGVALEWCESSGNQKSQSP
jgi:hypothetical protein